MLVPAQEAEEPEKEPVDEGSVDEEPLDVEDEVIEYATEESILLP